MFTQSYSSSSVEAIPSNPLIFQQGLQATQGDIQKNIVCMWYDSAEDGKMGSEVIVLLVYFLRVNKNLKSS